MELIGMLDSPYVRRVAISLHLLGVPFTHRPLSVFRSFDQFREINPVVKAPTLVCDDGDILIDSTLILDYIDALKPSRTLMPATLPARLHSLRVIGIALAACEKTVQIFYEHDLRPPESLHQPWLDRVQGQLFAAYDMLEQAVAKQPLETSAMGMDQAGVTTAVAWRFTQFILPGTLDETRYPALRDFSAQAEKLDAFIATPLD